jgi:cellulose synthase/poly-beta-1,6-N-acetylglucosamine synthase-like glycosyltransferase
MSEFAAYRPQEAGYRQMRGRVPARRAPAPRPLPQSDLPAELAALEHLVDPAIMEAVAWRAEALGVGGDEVLRCHGILTPDEITKGIASHLSIEVDALDGADMTAPLLAAQAGVFARNHRGRTIYTVAPRGLGLRRFCEEVARDPKAARYLRLASPERLAEHIREATAEEVAAEAVHGLNRERPDLSAVGYGWSQLRWFTIFLCLALAGAGVLAPGALLIAAEYFLALCFVGWTLLRLIACFVRHGRPAAISVPHRSLPTYTIIVPLYREAPVVAKLIDSLKRLRYPPEKLDIKLLLEDNDLETRAEVAKLDLTAPFEIVAPPRTGPQTKPRALATALLFARGSYLTVYDAEDEPEPDQLLRALAAFAADPSLACVQAKLSVDNVSDGWLSRLFASEYSGQFDVFLPALARFRLPIPLGGTSNHFRVDILREVGGWDPFNVTEDADLGMRLARFGYRIGTVDSTTWEEAPVGFRQWLRQRTRWLKGWMQTWIVHMRYPLRLLRELGLRDFISFQLLIGGTMISALVHPFFMTVVGMDIVSGELFTPGETIEHSVRKGLAVAVLGIGYAGAVTMGLIGLSRRGLLGSAWVVATIPIYWMLLSIAAWRALWQLAVAPHHWEKTPHGLARSSRRRQGR